MSATAATPPRDLSFPAPTAAVIPAAGWGTRLRPLTAGALPKEMLPVGRHLALERIVEELRAAGVRRIVFVTSPAKEGLFRRHFGDGMEGLSFAYALQPEMRGLGDAVLRARPLVDDGGAGDRVLIALGDAVVEEEVPGVLTGRLLRAAAERDATVGLVVQRVGPDRISRYGVVRPAGNGAAAIAGGDPFPITDIVEKPAPEEAPSPFAAAARYVITARDLFETLERTPPAANGELQLTDALRGLLRDGARGVAVPLRPGEVRHDLGGLDSYYRAFAAFALRDPDHGEGLRQWLRDRIDAAPPPEAPGGRVPQPDQEKPVE
jgi:UTP--glucose-1-phosphate uridylyltransferase